MIRNKKAILNNPQRITEIAYNIETHYGENFQGKGLKAQIVAPSKYSAMLFQRHFELNGKINTALIISDTPDTGDEEDSHKKEFIDHLKQLNSKHKNLNHYEKKSVESFKKEERGIEILIVVDKLLTGFDAPRNTVLYLAKDLKDHNLLQAIARVNRIYENKTYPKNSGFIIDYSESAQNIKSAMELFGNYDSEDITHTLIEVSSKIKELEEAYHTLGERFKGLKNSKDDQAYLEKLSEESDRNQYYKELNQFIRHLSECMALQDFSRQFKSIDLYKEDLRHFLGIAKSARAIKADEHDLLPYKDQLIKILDQYVDAQEVESLTQPINMNDSEAFAKVLEEIGPDQTKAKTIAAQLQKNLDKKEEKDPEFFHRFSDKISSLLQKIKEGKITDLEALIAMKEIKEQVIKGQSASTPKALNAQKVADLFYRNLKEPLSAYDLSDEALPTKKSQPADPKSSLSLVEKILELAIYNHEMISE